MQRHNVVVNVEKCLRVPSKSTALSFPSPLPESCVVEIAEVSDYRYPFYILFGEVHLHINDYHPSEERGRFRSESANGSENTFVMSSSTLVNEEVNCGDIDLEITHATAESTNTSTEVLTQQSIAQLPKIRLNSPFVCVDDDIPEMFRGVSHASSDSGCGGRHVWQCALLGLPGELTLEDLYCFLAPYADDIGQVAVIQVPEEASANFVKGAENDSLAISFVGTYKTCIIDFISKGPMLSFCALYNDLHFPTHSSIPPCVTLQIADVTMEPPLSISDKGTDGHGDTQICDNVNAELSNNCTRVSLPACAVCIRRLTRDVSGVHSRLQPASSSPCEGGIHATSASESLGLLVGPDFTSNGDRCKVCFIYGNAHSRDAVSKSFCQVCGITENIWVCLQCGYAGCGRYTAQHAKNHFHDAGHPFSLELVTGRIWSYVGDRFVHVDPLSEYLQTSSSSDMLLTSSQSWSDLEQSQSERCGRRSPWEEGERGLVGCISKSPRAREVGGDGEEEATRRLLDRLDLHTSDKLGSLQHDYDEVLDMQLKDQELYYEKLIARETVRLLETGYAEYGCNEFLSGLESNGAPSVLSEEDLAAIEAMKMEISALEYEYQEQLRELCLEESVTASVRQDNNQLLNTQKHLRSVIADRKMRTQEIKDKESEQTTALHQDIRDMEFFLRTSEEMSQATPAMQSDVREGAVLIGESNNSNSRNKKKGGGSNGGNNKKNKKKR